MQSIDPTPEPKGLTEASPGLPTEGERSWSPWFLGLILAVAVLLVYSNTLNGPFQYDDAFDIKNNLTIRRLWPLWDLIYVPGKGFMTRPMVNLTFALNYALGGFRPFPYHLTNLLIHLGASLALLGVVRRSLALSSLRGQFLEARATLPLLTAALWALHPLLTESVSYITQRYESLMGMFVLLTFYALLRAAAAKAAWPWELAGAMACLMALGSKEVAVSLPVLVLLFDRTFLAGSFRGALTARRTLYLGFLGAWGCFLVVQGFAIKREFAGFGLDMPWWRYALNQPNVILHYLRLTVWPHPLNFDYFWPAARSWAQLAPGLVVVGGLLGLTAWAWVRKPGAAFLATCFFLILAPTSSLMPILDLAVEHRMYLPLAPLVVLLVLVPAAVLQDRGPLGPKLRAVLAAGLAGVIAVFATLTYLRNEDYQSTIDLWRDASIKSPRNPRAHHNLAFALQEAGSTDESLREYARCIELAPDTPIFRTNFGVLLGRLGRYEEALVHLRRAVELEPTNYKNVYNLGVVLWQKGSLDNAVVCFAEAIKVSPRTGTPYSGLASALLAKREVPRALELVRTAISLEPQSAWFRYQLGVIQLKLGDPAAAEAAFQSAVRLDGLPENTLSDSGWAFHEHGHDREALAYLREALRRRPDHMRSHVRLGWIYATSPKDGLRDGKEAMRVATMLLRVRTDRPPELLDLLAVALAETGQFVEAQAALQAALAQSKDRSEKWVPEMEARLRLFEGNQPFRQPPPAP
jgi:Flp pilus assembly protein TadD